jgi:hypothetical protein
VRLSLVSTVWRHALGGERQARFGAGARVGTERGHNRGMGCDRAVPRPLPGQGQGQGLNSARATGRVRVTFSVMMRLMLFGIVLVCMAEPGTRHHQYKAH